MLHGDREVRTRTLARIVGPYLIIAAVAMLARFSTLPVFLMAFMEDDQLVFVTGAFTVMAGTAMVTAHHHWNGVTAALLSFVGIVAVAKGASLMIAPDFGGQATNLISGQPSILMGAIIVDMVLGVWFAFVGWRPRPSPPAPPT